MTELRRRRSVSQSFLLQLDSQIGQLLPGRFGRSTSSISVAGR